MTTIPAAKQAFLAAQTQLLAQPLAPSRAWLAGNEASEAPLPGALVRDALAGVNGAVAGHARRAYAPLASRNVAEQIEELYGRDVEGEEGVDGGVDRGGDLTQRKIIEELPDAWPEREAHKWPAEAHRYAATVTRLRELSARRDVLAARVGRLRRVRAAAELLRTGDAGPGAGAGAGVQENLATRGGAVERELERMRLLMVRVAGRVGALSGEGAAGRVGSGGGEGASADKGRAVDVDGLGGMGRKGVEGFLEERMFRDP